MSAMQGDRSGLRFRPERKPQLTIAMLAMDILPLDGVICLDLPLNVVNMTRAVEMVGGAEEIARVSANAAYAKDPEPLQLQLRNNRFHHPVASSVAQSKNIVVELEIPANCAQTTGRNRPDLRAALAAAQQQNQPVKITPKFRIDALYRFNGVADFQYYCGNSRFLKRAETSLFAGNLNEIETLSFHEEAPAEPSPQDDGADLLPPPRFSTLTQPFYYAYKQTPYLKLVDDGLGNQQLVHTVSNVKVYSNILTWGDAVPLGPPPGLEKTPRTAVAKCITELDRLFAQRPSYTRRWLLYYLGPIMSRYLKFALPYVAYYYRSGPWRGAYIKYGFDPSKHSELAPYQVEHFRITADNEVKDPHADFEDDERVLGGATTESPTPGPASPAHGEHFEYKFDGTKCPDVPMLQLKDIADGFLEEYIYTQDLRSKVDPNDGWYKEDTAIAIRKVLRSQLVVLKESKPALTKAEKLRIVEDLAEPN